MNIEDLRWRFSNRRYTDLKSFESALRIENDQIATEKWAPSAVAATTSELLVQYMCNISSDDLQANEFLSESDQEIFEQYPDERAHQVDVFAKLTADNNEHFTVVELLLKTHNQLANKELGDHVFYEGLDPEPGEVNGLPVFYVSAGS